MTLVNDSSVVEFLFEKYIMFLLQKRQKILKKKSCHLPRHKVVSANAMDFLEIETSSKNLKIYHWDFRDLSK